MVQGARAVEDRKARVAEVGRRDRAHVAESAVDVVVGADEVAHRVERVGDLRVVERDLVRDPLVVDVGARLTEHEVLDPVGAGPSGGRARGEADAPRLSTAPESRMSAVRAVSPSSVSGTSQPFSSNIDGEYQM